LIGHVTPRLFRSCACLEIPVKQTKKKPLPVWH
jgi:hypothetical protein